MEFSIDLDISDLVEQVANEVDAYDVAEKIDAYRIAEQIDLSDLADELKSKLEDDRDISDQWSQRIRHFEEKIQFIYKMDDRMREVESFVNRLNGMIKVVKHFDAKQEEQ